MESNGPKGLEEVVVMLSRPLAAVTPPPSLSLANEGYDDDDRTQEVPPVHRHPSPPAPPPPPPPPCCSCSALLPRLLSAHRMEVRRLLRGALLSLGRRLDALERRSRSRKTSLRRKTRNLRGGRGEEERGGGGRGGGACSSTALRPHLSGLASHPCSSPSACSSAPLPFSSSSSSDSEESPMSLLPSCHSQSDWRTRGEENEGIKRRSHHGRGVMPLRMCPVNRAEEDSERFVGRMAVSFRGGEEAAPLILHNLSHQRSEEAGSHELEKTVNVVVRQNGYRFAQALHSISHSSSQNALPFLSSVQTGHTNCSQSEGFPIFSRQWRFSDIIPPISRSFSSNHNSLHLWQYSSSFSPAPMLRLSVVAVETMASVRGQVCGSPLRPLKDWTAPPSLSSDHCYVRPPTPSPSLSRWRQHRQRANHTTRSFHVPRRRVPPPCSTNGPSVLLPTSPSGADSEFLTSNRERVKRVSQIRIRRASPRETPLTPMGLPKVKRLKKKEFSLEEIYTNKNYKSPSTNRSLETIFEEPREKDGVLLLIGQQRRRRLLLFPDFTQPRKRKRPQGVGLPVAMVPRKRAAARRQYHGTGDDEADLDVMLVERLSALEDFLTRQGIDV
ncbi:uncharacterized protein ACBR49_014613 isoform 2-T2 [Aulostomus maculatus]